MQFGYTYICLIRITVSLLLSSQISEGSSFRTRDTVIGNTKSQTSQNMYNTHHVSCLILFIVLYMARPCIRTNHTPYMLHYPRVIHKNWFHPQSRITTWSTSFVYRVPWYIPKSQHNHVCPRIWSLCTLYSVIYPEVRPPDWEPCKSPCRFTL